MDADRRKKIDGMYKAARQSSGRIDRLVGKRAAIDEQLELERQKMDAINKDILAALDEAKGSEPAAAPPPAGS